ncbi:MAG: hypothetical protein RMK89_13625, partial [Armatimonadota bacterium]|nr:hypothetical protein [Armatimonadota bacterium]MDW8144487.1 hypothetical protein [Armatimonadota bacterium]
LAVLFYLHLQKKWIYRQWMAEEIREEAVISKYMQETHGLKIGQIFRLSLPHQFIGSPPPLGRGYPVCFLNIGAGISKEIWWPSINEALKASPFLHVVLVFYPPPFERRWDWRPVSQFIQNLGNSRVSAIIGNWQLGRLWGQPMAGGILLVLCDGKGVIQAIEPYPHLKISPNWEEEVADWRPKLHQAVKKVLDKFFPRRGASTK